MRIILDFTEKKLDLIKKTTLFSVSYLSKLKQN